MKITPLNQQEVQAIRADTKGTKERIHFNNAGASLPPDVVVETMVSYLNEEAMYGGYETEYKYREELDNTYTLIARLINAGKDEVAIVENASIGWDIAFNGIGFEAGDEVITSEMEYVTNHIGLLSAKKTYGIILKVIANDPSGNFPLNELEDAITPKTKLIAITHVSSSAGTVVPIAEIGKIARKHQVLYLLDACQSIGQMPVDVQEIGCDMLAVTGRKYLRAPRGTGFLYVRKEIQDQLRPVFMDGSSATSVGLDDFQLRDDARRFELYEKNRALTLGLGKAIDYALNIGLDRIWERIEHLAALLRHQLTNIEGVTVYDTGNVQGGIVTFSVSGMDSTAVKGKLGTMQINVSIGKAISTPVYMDKKHLDSMVRASVHYYNTEEEIGVMCNVLASMVVQEALSKIVLIK